MKHTLLHLLLWTSHHLNLGISILLPCITRVSFAFLSLLFSIKIKNKSAVLVGHTHYICWRYGYALTGMVQWQFKTCEVCFFTHVNCLKSNCWNYSVVSIVCSQTWKLIFIAGGLRQITGQTVFKLQPLSCIVWTSSYKCLWCKILDIYINIPLKYIWSSRK